MRGAVDLHVLGEGVHGNAGLVIWPAFVLVHHARKPDHAQVVAVDGGHGVNQDKFFLIVAIAKIHGLVIRHDGLVAYGGKLPGFALLVECFGRFLMVSCKDFHLQGIQVTWVAQVLFDLARHVRQVFKQARIGVVVGFYDGIGRVGNVEI